MSVELIIGIVNSFAVLVTLTVLIWQTAIQTRQTRELRRSIELSSVDNMTDKLFRIYELMVQQPSLAEAVGTRKYTSQKAFITLVGDLYEMAFKQYKRGQLDKRDWSSWLSAMNDSFNNNLFYEHFLEMKDTYNPDFVNEITNKILINIEIKEQRNEKT